MLKVAAFASLCLLPCQSVVLAQTPPDGQPRDIVVSLYKLAATELKGAQASSPFFEAEARKKYLSKGFDRLVDVAEAKASKDGSAFLDFDPISSSQDAELKNVSVKTVVSQGNKAVISARFENHKQLTGVTYNVIAEDGVWKIDDIHGTSGTQAWSVRALLADKPATRK